MPPPAGSALPPRCSPRPPAPLRALSPDSDSAPAGLVEELLSSSGSLPKSF